MNKKTVLIMVSLSLSVYATAKLFADKGGTLSPQCDTSRQPETWPDATMRW